MLETEKQKNKKKNQMEKGQKPYKNSVFLLRWSSENWKNETRKFLPKLPDTICDRREKKRIFVHTICFGQNIFWDQNTENQENYKIVVSAEIVQNLKWHLFLKTVFLT